MRNSRISPLKKKRYVVNGLNNNLLIKNYIAKYKSQGQDVN